MKNYTQQLALPLTIVGCIVLSYLPILDFALRVVANTFIHEMGHAFTYLLGGRMALPSLFFVTIVFSERFSWTVFLVIASFLGFSTWFSYTRKFWFLYALCTSLLFLQLVLSFMLSHDTHEMISVFGGLAGEILIPTVIILMFFFPMPPRWNWQINRWVLLIPSVYCLYCSFLRWSAAALAGGDLPWGSAWGGKNDPHGDLNRLTEVFKWSKDAIIGTYFGLSIFSVFIILGVYAFFAWLKPLSESENLSESKKRASEITI